MSADIAYRLLVDMSSKGSLAPQLEKMGAQAKGLDSQFAKVGQSLTSGLSGAASALERVGDKVMGLTMSAAKFSAMGGAAGAAYGISLNSQLEQAKVGLGAIFSAQGISKDMTAGIDLASDTLKEMRKDARALPGEFGDLLSFFKLGATPGFQAGASVKQLEKLSAQGMAAAAATGVQMDQAAREFAQLMGGHAGGHNVFGSMIGLQGDKAREFNAMSGAERLKTLEKELGKYKGSIDYFGLTMKANADTLKDNAKETLRRATEPIFERTKEVFSKGNQWFSDHEKQIERFADKVGLQLLHGFDVGLRKIGEWGPALRSFGDHAAEEFKKIWEHARPLVEGLERLAKGGVAGKGLFKGLEAGALAYGGIKAAKLAAPIFSASAGLMGGGEAAAGMAGLAAGGAAIGTAAAIALVPLALAAGAFHAITDATSEFHEQATASAAAISANATKSLESMGKTWEKVQPSATKAMDFLGTQWLSNIELVSTLFEKATFGIGKFSDVFSRVLEKAEIIEGKGKPGPGPLDALLGKPENAHERQRWRDDDEFASKTKKGAGGGGGGTHIQKVEIVVSSNQDPNRIARLVGDRLLQLARNPTSSGRTPSGAR